MNKEIMLLGNLAIDRNTTESGHEYGGVGGSVYFTGKTQVNLHDTVHIISPLGKDFPIESLRGMEVLNHRSQFSHPVVFENTNYPNGMRKQRAYIGEGNNLYDLDNTLPYITRVDAVVVCPIIDNITVQDVQKVKSRFSQSLFVLQPQGLMRQVGKEGAVTPKDISSENEMIDLFDIVIFSEKDIPKWREKALSWRKKGRSVVVTQSERGCTLFMANQAEQQIPTSNIHPIVDSTGSGDNFTGGLIHTYLLTQSMSEGCKTGNAVAGYSLRFRADQLQYSANDIKAFAKEQGRDIQI